jgi:hypothetical protein
VPALGAHRISFMATAVSLSREKLSCMFWMPCTMRLSLVSHRSRMSSSFSLERVTNGLDLMAWNRVNTCAERRTGDRVSGAGNGQAWAWRRWQCGRAGWYRWIRCIRVRFGVSRVQDESKDSPLRATRSQRTSSCW